MSQQLKLQTYDLSASQRLVDSKFIYRVDNFRYSSEGYLVYDRGWEPLKKYPTENSHLYIDIDFEPTRFLSVFTRHDTAEVYYLHEKGGYLIYEWGNGDSEPQQDRVYLQYTRHIPAPNEAGTQLTSLGNVAVLSNGVDEPVKFWGWETMTPFGFTSLPPAPDVYGIRPAFKTDQLFPDEPSTCQDLPGDGFYGITPDNTHATFSLGWRVSYVTDTGSESPLSEATVISFKTTTGESGRYVAHMHIPVGPDNVVARRLYRTHQMTPATASNAITPNTGSIGQYYLVKQINENSSTFVSDSFPDSLLTAFAPGYGDRVNELIVPIQNFQFSCMWDGRLWVSGGEYESTVIYSEKPQAEPPKGPETFAVLNRINFGNGGKVWGLVGFNQYLIVFRERSIEYIYKLNDGTYAFTTLTDEVGTTATNTIKATPHGLVFLAPDGFYAISMGDTTPGAQSPSIRKISQAIDDTIKYVNTSAMPRATAVWNPIEKEYWCHFPLAGDTDNTCGAVLHSNGFWTFRRATNDSNNRRFSATQLAFDGKYTVMGMVPWDSSVTEGTSGLIEAGTWRNIGLQVWCATDRWSPVYSDGINNSDEYTFTLGTGSRGLARIESTWLNFGDPTKKKSIKSVELIALGTGYESITLQYAVNNRHVFESAGTKNSIHENKLTTNDAVYGPVTAPQRGTGEWNTSVCNSYRAVVLRFDLSTNEVDSLKLKVTSDDHIGIVGFNVIYFETPTRNQ